METQTYTFFSIFSQRTCAAVSVLSLQKLRYVAFRDKASISGGSGHHSTIGTRCGTDVPICRAGISKNLGGSRFGVLVSVTVVAFTK